MPEHDVLETPVDDDEEQPVSLPVRIGMAATLLIVLVVGVYFLVHLSVRPINPAQKTPAQHFAADCVWCHDLRADAPLVKE